MIHINSSGQSQQKVYSEPPKQTPSPGHGEEYVHTLLTHALTHPKSCQGYFWEAEEQTDMTET